MHHFFTIFLSGSSEENVSLRSSIHRFHLASSLTSPQRRTQTFRTGRRTTLLLGGVYRGIDTAEQKTGGSAEREEGEREREREADLL